MIHHPTCRWERTPLGECEYRATHHYCPHPEHACDCPPPSAVEPYTREELRNFGDSEVWTTIRSHIEPEEAQRLERLFATAAAAVERGVRETTDTERLDFLIDWLGLHDDLEGSRIRDWSNNADARAAIDEARERRATRSGRDSKGGAE